MDMHRIWGNHDDPKLDTASTVMFPKPHGIQVDGRAQTVCSLRLFSVQPARFRRVGRKLRERFYLSSTLNVE